MRCARPGSRSSARPRRRPGSSRARRSATRSRAAAGVRMARAEAFHDAGRPRSRSRASSPRDGPRRRGQGGRPGGRQGRDGLRRRGRGGTGDRALAATRPSAASLRPAAGRSPGSSSRSGWPAARRASSRSATAGSRSRCRWPATTSGCSTAIAARTRAGWAPTARSRTCPTTAAESLLAAFHRPDPRRAGPARDPVPWRALRRPDADRGRPGPARVQRALRRPRDAGDPAAAGRRARPAPAGGGARRPGAGARGSRGPRRDACRPCPGATVAIVLAAAGYPDAPRAGDRSRGSRTRRRPARSSSTPARRVDADGTVRTAGGRVARGRRSRARTWRLRRAAAARGRRPDPCAGPRSAGTTSAATVGRTTRPDRPARRPRLAR